MVWHLLEPKRKSLVLKQLLTILTMPNVWGTGGSVTWMKGREKPQNGAEQDMTGFRIPPLKLTGYISYSPTETWTNLLTSHLLRFRRLPPKRQE